MTLVTPDQNINSAECQRLSIEIHDKCRKIASMVIPKRKRKAARRASEGTHVTGNTR